MDLIEWIEVKNKGKIISGVMPVISLTEKFNNAYAFKYINLRKNKEYIFVFFMITPYTIFVGKTYSTLPIDSAKRDYIEDTNRNFLKYNDANLMEWIDAYIERFGEWFI